MHIPQQPSASETHGPFGLVVTAPGRSNSMPQKWTDWLLFMVPLFIAELGDVSEAEFDRIRTLSIDLIASHGDHAQYGGQHRASARTAIARGLAALARADGGVTALGIHACLRQHIDCPGRSQATSTHDPAKET